MTCTLVVSDVHLCGVVPDDCRRMFYRQRRYCCDDALVALLREAPSWTRGAPLDVVFNGDLFDFDAPPPHDIEAEPVRFADAAANRALEILMDHPEFVDAVRWILRSKRNRVIFVTGNHDAQLVFPCVRDALTSVLADSVGARQKIVFQRLFHRTPCGVHIEHGHQYDPPCAIDPMAVDVLPHTIGSVASCRVPALFGCMNPYVSDPLNVKAVDLLESVRQCGTLGIESAIKLIRETLLVESGDVCDHSILASALAIETKQSRDAVLRHLSLFSKRADASWISTTGKSYGRQMEDSLRAAAKSIAGIYSARGVVMGHTHEPVAMYNGGVFYGNTGSWAPALGDGTGSSGYFAWIVPGEQPAICRYEVGR